MGWAGGVEGGAFCVLANGDESANDLLIRLPTFLFAFCFSSVEYICMGINCPGGKTTQGTTTQ